MRSLVVLACAIAMLAAPLQGQTSAGLLLGERFDWNGYRTLWITASGDRVRIDEVPNDLLVAQSSGFWLARVVPPRDDEYSQDALWVRPLTTTTTIAPHAPRRRQSLEPDDCTDEAQSTTITFAAPRHLGVSRHEESICNGHVNTSDTIGVLPLNRYPIRTAPDTANWVSLHAISEEAAIAFARSAAARVARVDADDRNDYAEPNDFNWTLARSRGQWLLSGMLDPACSRCPSASFDVDVNPPAEIVGVRQALEWDAIKDAVPDAQDAFSSPQGDWVVVLTRGDRLQVYAARGGRLRELKLDRRHVARGSVPTPIMAEWATGHDVARWSRAVAQLRTHAEPVSR
jgi:hypothetical protein